MASPPRKRILCVEDERSLATLYKNLLEAEGYAVDIAYDGEEGLKMILTDEYDLILLNTLLPKMTGPEVMQKLQEVKLKGMLGMLTNIVSDDNIEQALEYRANFYMVKQCYDPTSFILEIKSLLDKDACFVGSHYYDPSAPPESDINTYSGPLFLSNHNGISRGRC